MSRRALSRPGTRVPLVRVRTGDEAVDRGMDGVDAALRRIGARRLDDIPDGDTFKRVRSATATVDPGSVSANSILDVDVTVEGIRVGDRLWTQAANFSTDPALTLQSASVLAVDRVRLRYGNTSGGALNPASHEVYVAWVRP